jgi:hypothetical protein
MDAREKGTKDHPDAVFRGPSDVSVPGHPADVLPDIRSMSEIPAGQGIGAVLLIYCWVDGAQPPAFSAAAGEGGDLAICPRSGNRGFHFRHGFGQGPA